MCTSLTLNGTGSYFGRNMDVEYTFGERVVVTPRGAPLPFRQTPGPRTHHALIGMSTVAAGYPLYAEAMNEKGLYMAGLNFPESAHYAAERDESRDNVSPFELIPWVLGQCGALADARALLGRLHLVDAPFSREMPSAPLHWHVADASGALVVEPLESGVKIYEDPVGVLTNEPPFDFHLHNLRQYLNLTPTQPSNRFCDRLGAAPFGQGMGGVGLPGDCSPASRYVRAAFLKVHSACPTEESAAVSQFLHILDAVAMVRGSVVTPQGKDDITSYACCISAGTGTYYYKTYDNCQLTAVSLFHEDLDGTALREFPLAAAGQVLRVN